MSTREHRVRRSGRLILAALACWAPLACSDGSGGVVQPDPPPVATALQVVSPNPHTGIAGYALPDAVLVRVVDQRGRGLPGVEVRFSFTSDRGFPQQEAVSTDGTGQAKFMWILGTDAEQSAVARVEGLAPVTLRARTADVSESTKPMLGVLASYVQGALQSLESTLPLNPGAASYIESKIALLRRPGIGAEIIDGRRYVEGSVASRSGSALPTASVFPAESLRGEAGQALRYVDSALPVLEGFLSAPFPASGVQLWYGFRFGSAGGGGGLHMEDRGTYEARTTAARMPYDAILVHELAHSYVGSESLTQFLDLYGYNVPRTGSDDVRTWQHTRGYVPDQPGNEGVHAVLDVYRMIGPEAMASAYRAVLTLRPAYGQPLSAAAQQMFVDAAPEALKAQVAQKMARLPN